MTNKKIFAFVAIFVSVLGFAFIEALKPVIVSYSAKQYSVNSQYAYSNKEVLLKKYILKKRKVLQKW